MYVDMFVLEQYMFTYGHLHVYSAINFNHSFVTIFTFLYKHLYYIRVGDCTQFSSQAPYSGKFSREKTFTNFAIFQPSAKVFSTKF